MGVQAELVGALIEGAPISSTRQKYLVRWVNHFDLLHLVITLWAYGILFHMSIHKVPILVTFNFVK